mmetsp:Transcript_9597/g.12535  ORF Transcript_9597/g.12535 Transcript_9597/m.12535 type:complete len:94 (+) Transcript_9597:593-874(+)
MQRGPWPTTFLAYSVCIKRPEGENIPFDRSYEVPESRLLEFSEELGNISHVVSAHSNNNLFIPFCPIYTSHRERSEQQFTFFLDVVLKGTREN